MSAKSNFNDISITHPKISAFVIRHFCASSCTLRGGHLKNAGFIKLISRQKIRGRAVTAPAEISGL
jgi:hypothetical protein